MEILFILILYLFFFNFAKADESLIKGALISSDEGSSLVKYAFDNKFNTQFISIYPSNGWVGINFRNQYVITRIEWGTNETDSSTYLLGIFEGANEKTYEDAFPLYMITNEVFPNVLNNVNIILRRSIQYIRYIGPYGKFCKINNIRVYGTSFSDNNDIFYKPSNLPLLTVLIFF